MDNLDKLIKEAEKEFKIEFVNYGELIGEGLCIHKTKGLIFIAKYIRKAYNLGRLEEINKAREEGYNKGMKDALETNLNAGRYQGREEEREKILKALPKEKVKNKYSNTTYGEGQEFGYNLCLEEVKKIIKTK